MSPVAQTAPVGHAAARLSTRLAFAVAGFGVAAWAPLIPFVKQRLAVDDRNLGLLLLCLGLGSVLAMLKTGPLCTRHGCKPVVLVGGAGMALCLPVLALAPSPGWMALALGLFGAALGGLEVGMNVHAVEVERQAHRPLMSGFHALFSVGGFLGSVAVTALLALSVSPWAATVLCAVPMAAALVVVAPRLLTLSAAEQPPGPAAALAVPRGPVVLLAVLAAVTFLVEGALLDWSALLLTTASLSTPEQAGMGYAAFSMAMTVGRFSGDAITARWGDRAVVLGGGLGVLGGFAVLLTASAAVWALVGFVAMGLGASNVVPVLFRQAGRQQAMPAAMAVSAVTTVGYAGYLLGPALVGWVSSLAGLVAAFWMLAGLMCLVPLCAGRVTARPGG